MKDVDAISADVVNAAIRIHRDLGPGLLESVYEMVLAGALIRLGYKVDRQLPVDINYDGCPLPRHSVWISWSKTAS